jgi:hypothetical protein
METEEKLLSWEVDEYDHRHKSNDWYWALGLIILCITIASIIYQNYLFAFLMLVGGALLGYYAKRLPGRVEIFITKKGLDTHDGFVPFEQITHFYIPPGLENKLYLHTKRNLMQVVIVSLENIDHDKVRDALEPYIKEKEIEEPFVSVVSKMLGL